MPFYWSSDHTYFAGFCKTDIHPQSISGITYSLMFVRESLFEYFNPFCASVLFHYLMNTSENNRFSEVFRGYRKRLMTGNELTSFKLLS